MTPFKSILRLILCCLLASAIFGCFSTKYIAPKQYLLNLKTLPEKKTTLKHQSVFISQVTGVSPFNQVDFLYRISSKQYLTDYYHSFLASPSQQVNSALKNYLKALGKFRLDPLESSAANKLQTQITEFYADYRDPNHPQAVVALHFTLTHINNNKDLVLFDKTLRAEVALTEKNAESLLNAWSWGLQDILRRAVLTLNKIT